MGTTSPLRQLLVGLCDNTSWKYSVFWKLNHQTPLVLTWEDGYYDITKPEETWEIKSFSSVGTSMLDVGHEGSSVRLLMENMARSKYSFGEGLVGEVAYSGNYMWVSPNSFFVREFENELRPDSMDEWLLQIALGIKTVLLVPAFPDGVIQLGSLEEVSENHAVVVLVKDRFDAYIKAMETIPFKLKSTQSQSSSSSPSPFSLPVENLNASRCKQLKREKLEDFDFEEMRLPMGKCTMSTQTVQDSFLEAEKEAVDLGFLEEFMCPSLSFSEVNLETLDSKMFDFSCVEEEVLSHYLSGDQNVEFFGEPLNEYSSGLIDDGRYKTMDNLFKFEENFELHKALGPEYLENTHETMSGSSFFIEDADVKSTVLGNEDHLNNTKVCGSEYLLEAVIANLFSSSENPPSPSWITSSRPSCSSQPQVESKEVLEMGKLSGEFNLAAPAIFTRVDSSTSLDGMASTLTNVDSEARGRTRASSSRAKKSNVKTSRAKNGNNHKPRPRDRQLIQDRVKELRELVPSGSKCSIDGLLDRTIKHMMYLRSVAEQAEKLKGTNHQELASGKNQNSSETSSTSQNGTSWAFEFGNDTQVCPIVVEDLEVPGHMLIEVLCDDHGLFLEIAQLIRRLDLTILKGVMENRSSKTWAHFVVEATKGFHRMEIFWPLLHLLQRKKSRISSRI